MMMNKLGCTKLTEECAELITVLAKADAFGSLGEHWDGGGNLQKRLQDEIADVLAALIFTTNTIGLNHAEISKRVGEKLRKFDYWENGGHEKIVPSDYAMRWFLVALPNSVNIWIK